MIEWLRRLASLKLTLAIFGLLAISILLAYRSETRTSPWLVVSLTLLAFNLLAAIATNPYFRRQLPLLGFHLALLSLILLIALGRLTYLRGQAEVVEGTEFSGNLVKVDAGPWHSGALDQVRFVNEGFRIDYAEGLTRLGTQNRVSWRDDQGSEQSQVVGDHVPLVLKHYRFYTTSNKGFALVFEWQPKVGRPAIGTVNLPSYPANSLKQARQWSLPGLSEPLWAMLQFEGELIPHDRAGEFRLPDDYQIVVRHGEQRWELPMLNAGVASGLAQSIELPGGKLVYRGLRSWMGYMVVYDRTLPWLLLAAGLAVLAMAWHFWRKFSAQPWNPDNNATPGAVPGIVD
jgi:hypothetical protein